MGQIHINHYLLSVLQDCLDPENYGLWNSNQNRYRYIYLYIYNCSLCTPNVLIFGWQSSNTGAQARGALGSVPKVIFATVSFRLIYYPSLSLYPSHLSPPPLFSVTPPWPPSVSPPNSNPPVPTISLSPLAPYSASPPDTGP